MNGSTSELWSISWEVPAPFLQPQNFLVAVQDLSGLFISPPTQITIPGPAVGDALTYPVGLSWDAPTDRFWFLERNADTFWELSPQLQLEQSLPHPNPPFQPFVFNLGLSVDSTRGTITATTAEPDETMITFATEITLEQGLVTGERIDLDQAAMSNVYGIIRDESSLFVVGSSGSLPQILELKASDPVASPVDLTCEEATPLTVTLTWQEPVPYDEVVIKRGGVVIQVLAGGLETYTDVGLPLGPRAYTVLGRDSVGESAPTACALEIQGSPASFIRGDFNGDNSLNVADAIGVLTYLFQSGPEPSCFDAADVDDTGNLQITDAIYLLNYLFSGGAPPPPPFPAPGTDPTGDSLSCTP